MEEKNINGLTIKELFSGVDRYLIPIYQRNYAWTDKEIYQLVQDIADSAKVRPDKIYHIGTLVVFDRLKSKEIVYETIDGQQRLTTLVLLLSALKREYKKDEIEAFNWFSPKLEFASRISSTETLDYLTSDRELDQRFFSEESPEVYEGFKHCSKSLRKILSEADLKPKEFILFLINKVQILRVSVPPDTDLNHYFEIMNSRGEQLEKHEILKARLLEVLNEEDDSLSHAFNLIWEGCSNMERYIQYAFVPDERELIFGNDWDDLIPESLEDVSHLLIQHVKDGNVPSKGHSLIQILNSKTKLSFNERLDESKADNEFERFTSVINFQNFLLHVLRVQTNVDIPLDDKRLLDSFNKFFEKGKQRDKLLFVKEFGFNLLKAKYLFDKFIIKREYLNSQDGWSLKRLKRVSGTNVKYINSFGEEEIEDDKKKYNRKILMLLSMFHVSTPTQIYKHWLSGVLKYLMNSQNPKPIQYRNYLERLARSFLFDRYLADDENRFEFFQIIFENEGSPQNTDTEYVIWEYLNQGTDVENFIFNFLDYLLWKNRLVDSAEKFEFTFRSSVEHYYPQNPMDGFSKLKPKISDHFGNLCLISGSRNSRLNNYMPFDKKEHYQASPSVDSLKQRKMMKYLTWNEVEILEHGEEMRQIFEDQLNHEKYN